MSRDLPKYVYRHVDRHGKLRLYFRPPGKGSTPLPSDPTSPEFAAAYKAALVSLEDERQAPKAILSRPKVRTLRWLCDQYTSSTEFKRLDPRTQRVRRQIIEHCLNEPIRPGASETFGDGPLEVITPKAIKVLRDRKADFPEAANSRVKAFRQVYSWALEAEVDDSIKTNPARDVRYFQSTGEGFHSWTMEELEQFEARHPVGTRARLALALLLYTGQRRSDIVRFGRQHLRPGEIEFTGRKIRCNWLHFTQWKNRNRKPVRLEIPVIPELQRIIDASPTGDLTFLVTELGQPFTANGFGNKMRQWCDEAGLPQCSAHGLRKVAAVRLAELGCTTLEIASILGHMTLKQIELYTRSVRQRRLAENVLRRVISSAE